ncbi:ABC-three component system middle component 2 [Propionibacterium freudenreichii]|uniref:ABC-three component system middle component 2 n=1 Tax=Propionibacterium freudenreichii TaxID=1744 RepID=UPI003854A970
MTQLLNSPLEVGVRVVAMLNALYPRQADLSRIVLLDHVALHSEDFSGAESLHPAVPVRIGELGMKRELVRQGIILMGVRGLIVRNLNVSGIYYGASDDARPFLESIDSAYLTKLRRRCA